MIARIAALTLGVLSICWLVAAPDWEPLVVTVGSLAGLIGIEISNDRKTRKSLPLIIDDVSFMTFPPRDKPPFFDFRVQNPNDSTVGITRILFKVVDYQIGPSMIAKQKISDEGKLVLDSSVKTGDVLGVAIAVRVKAKDTDRLIVEVSWSGPTSDRGRYYTLIPALKTSLGYVECIPISVHIQEDFSKRNSRPHGIQEYIMPPAYEHPIENSAIDWKREESNARAIPDEKPR